MSSDFDGINAVLSAQQIAEAEAIASLKTWLSRSRQACATLAALDAAHPSATAAIISRCSAAQEAKLRALWAQLQSFAAADPATDAVPDLPAP